jgi:hypothetical protein
VSDPLLATALASHAGKVVVASTADGLKYEGVLASSPASASATAAAVVTLRHGKLVEGSSAATRAEGKESRGSKPVQALSIPVSKLVSVVPKEQATSKATGPALTVATSQPKKAAEKVSIDFATDSEISFGSYEQSGPGRELKRFSDFAPSEVVGRRKASAFGEEELAPSQRWNQFDDNKRLFGVTTSFNEDDYTTKINKKDPNFAKRMAEAARIAAEIESAESSNPHVREERGLPILDRDGDEEDRYSGVRRPTQPKTSLKATEPHHRRSYAAATSGGGGVKTVTSAIVENVASRPPRSPQTERAPPLSASSPGSSSSVLLPPAISPSERVEAPATARSASGSLTNNRRSRENLAQFARQPVSGRSSPTPNRNSPSLRPSTPSNPDTAAIRNLSLEAQTPGVGPEAVKQFEKFKAERELQSVVEGRDKITEELKKFSNEHAVNRSRGVSKTDSSSSSTLSPSPLAGYDNQIPQPQHSNDEDEKAGSGKVSLVTIRKSSELVNDPQEGTLKPKRTIAHKLNPNAPSFAPDSEPSVFQPSAPQAFVLSTNIGIEYSNSLLPAAPLSGPVGQDMSMYMYMQDPNMDSAPMNVYGQGQYQSPGIVNYTMPSQPMPSAMGPSVMHPNALPASYSGMARQPYGMPYQPSVGPGTQGRSYGPGAQPYGLPVPASVIPQQGHLASPYVPSPSYSYSNNQAGMQVHPVPPPIIAPSPAYYQPVGPGGGRGGGGSRNRRGGRGGHYRQAQGYVHQGHGVPSGVHADSERTSDVGSRSSTDPTHQVQAQNSPN